MSADIGGDFFNEKSAERRDDRGERAGKGGRPLFSER
jgi:hypothetical protein